MKILSKGIDEAIYVLTKLHIQIQWTYYGCTG